MQLLKSKDISIGGHNKWAASKADSSNLFKYALYGGESNITFLSRGSISAIQLKRIGRRIRIFELN